MPAVLYEVTAIVDGPFREAFEAFLRDVHIPDVMAAGAFGSAIFSRSAPGRYRVRYEAVSREVLDRYLTEKAPALREDVKARFPEGVELSREEWDVLAVF